MKQKTAYPITSFAMGAPLAARGEALPSKKLILKWGENPTVKGLVRVGSKTLSLLPQLQKKLGFDRIPIDYEHNTVPGTPAFKNSVEPREVAAYATPFVDPEGIWLLNIEYTPSGLKHALNYEDMSPAPSLDDDREVLFLQSVALTRAGAVEGLTLLSVELETETQTEEVAMDPYKKMLCALLGLDAEKATDEEITAATQSFGAKIGELETKVMTCSADIEALKPATGRLVTLGADLVQIRAELVKRDKNDLLSRAAREGKVITLSAEAIEKLSVADLADAVSKTAVTVPLSARTPVFVREEPVQVPSALDSVARRCGLDPAKVREVNQVK